MWTTTDNCSMRLHMTPNHLAWAKVTPIQDKSTIRALLERSKHNLTVSIPRRIATPSRKLVTIVDGALDTGVAVERPVEETTAEIDAIAISINMMPLVDPTFTGFIPGEPMFEGESVTASGNPRSELLNLTVFHRSTAVRQRSQLHHGRSLQGAQVGEHR